MEKVLLKYYNDWERDVYITSQSKIPVIELEEVEIDGSTFPVRTQEISIPYDDHGHIYHGTSNHFFIKEPSFGLEIDLNRIIGKHDVYATKYKLKE